MKQTLKALAALSLVALGLIVVSCNTTRGVGRDIEKAGDSLKDSAERHGAD
jgi:predicted small secreted protein